MKILQLISLIIDITFSKGIKNDNKFINLITLEEEFLF